MNIFVVSFYVLCVICAFIFFYTKQKVQTCNDPAFTNFQRVYLSVYILAAAGDWLQGPYVYALYASYGMTKKEIEILFVAGFGSSMVFGTFVGSIADQYGRKNNCILYGVLYGLSCVTKHFNNFKILMVGRLLGGVATSILFSAFESWLINEHNKRGFSQELQGTIFSHAVLGNSVIAIVAGISAQYAADYISYVAPFDISLAVLTVMCGIIVCTWSENYGDSSINIKESFTNAISTIYKDHKVFCLGIIQSLFEGSMYCFVLEWTPALTMVTPVPSTAKSGDSKPDTTVDGHRGLIPHGYIFAGFMVSVMMGSCIFKLLSKFSSVESFMRLVFVLSAVCLSLPFLFPEQQFLLFVGFLVFEVCVGIFWPSLGTLRGKYVPEDTRATIMNCFRVPLNLVVVIILTQNLSVARVFQCCVVFLVISAVCQHWIYRESISYDKAKKSQEPSDKLIIMVKSDSQANLESTDKPVNGTEEA